MDRGGVLYAVMVGCAGVAIAGALAIPGKEPVTIGRGGDAVADATTATFVNWETAHVHPVDLTPDGTRLLVVNTADNRLAVFSLASGVPVLEFEVPVGLDPISVRARTSTEVWVVNNISDTVSVVDLASRNVVATIRTADEPSDVAFAGAPQRAFVSCSMANAVQVFDPANLAALPQALPIQGERPRALGVSPDGQTVYAAVFESGNKSTILGGGVAGGVLAFPPNVVNSPSTPYGGVNPPPNAGSGFSPPIAPANQSSVPKVGMIVKQNAQGQWMDDNGGNWTSLVSGPQAAESGRLPGWTLPDRDLAVISTSNLSVSYAVGLMNICMGVGVNPATGAIAVIGTDAINEVRFEPNVKGRFVQVYVAMVDPLSLGKSIKDLNPHLLPYTAQQAAQSERDKSIGDPRGIAWNPSGTRAYITGMGSNNVVVVNAAGNRSGLAQTIEVGEGPTGVAFDGARNRVYVLNRFSASISVVDESTEIVVATVPFYDPTPTAIKAGRKHLYDTHKTSGLGQASCASCHVDGRIDRIGWDLGDPEGAIKSLAGLNLGANVPGLNTGFQPFHPMKGPMTTQTMQDIIGKEPFHWRADRLGLEEFNPAFPGLLGDDAPLTPVEMQEFKDFLATITFPPNPFRNFDNTLPATLPLTGHYSTGRFAGQGGLAAGAPLPAGRPNVGLALYRDGARRLDAGNLACVTCHTLPTGAGTDHTFSLATGTYQPIAPSPSGARHLALVSQDGSTNVSIKVPQIRNAYMKVGFELTKLENTAGFGFLHDGSVDSLYRFVTEPVFTTANDQEAADLVAFMLCLSGSDLPQGSVSSLLEPPGVPSKDVPASVGWQTTVENGAAVPPAQATLINSMVTRAQSSTSRVGLIVKGVVNGQQRGYVYQRTSGQFKPDRASEAELSAASLLALAHPGGRLTYTVVPRIQEARMGIDRDENGVLDRDQADIECYANCDGSLIPPILNVADFSCFLNLFASGDPRANCDGSIIPPMLNVADFACFLNRFAAGCP
jgi:YVTN family beta-propeller protein